MEMFNIYPAIAAFFTCLMLGFSLMPLARKIGLTDKPDERKSHKGNIPLIGGVIIWLSLIIVSIGFGIHIANAWAFYTAGTLAVILGALDDRYHLSVKSRFTVQIIISLIMAIGASNSINNLGAIFGPAPVTLDSFSYVFTAICIVGVMNAINMIDGIDGLAASVCSVTLASILTLSNDLNSENSQTILIVLGSVLAFLILNLNVLRLPQRKIFLGDAGSMMLGLVLVWFLASSTQSEAKEFRPITAVWLLALPLIDMAAIMFRRMRKKQSPFKPDRDHLHHICIRAELSNKKSLCLISAIALLLSAVGVIGEIFSTPEYLMFAGFICLLSLYSLSLQHIWKIIKLFRKQ